MFLRYFSFLLLGASALHAASGPSLTVDAAANQHPISPLIYGINEWTDSGLSGIMHIGVRRWGGDNATSYNWQLDLKNNDDDWYFTTYLVGDGVTSTFDLFHERNLATGTASLGTVPVLDWTPKMPPAGTQSVGGVLSCSYTAADFPSQQKFDPYDSTCGNGLTPSGGPIVTDPSKVYQPITPAFAGAWVTYIKNKYGAANDGGVQMWSLDNEPEWWDGVHTDIYPQAATYDDMLHRDMATAQAVKAADPTALVTGPVPAGWSGMLFSRADFDSGWNMSPYQYWDNPVDYKAHGSVYWVPYFLQQMAAFEKQNGTRLLDYLDVHGYITPPNIGFDTDYSSANTLLRMQSTRAFWDPNYIVPGGGYYDATGAQVPTMLVPQMIGWVSKNYPGTKTAITEYNWGALEDITGAVAQADILGIFGREGLDMGTMWPDGNFAKGVPGAYAFQMFLNYDGVGGQFGQTSVSATTSDADNLAIYAAQRVDSALTVMVLNKSAAAITDSFSLAHFTPAGSAQVWQYSSANLNAIVRQGDAAASGGSISATFPAYSMTLFVIPANQSMMTVPQPVVTSVKSAASYNASGIAPGELVAVFGQSLAPAATQYATLDSAGKVSTNLGGVQVLFNGEPGALIATTAGQINVIVPYEVALYSKVNVEVINQGNASTPFPMPVVAAVPGMFTSDYSGQGQAAVLNQDNSVNSAKNPEQRGNRVQIFATGEGLTNPPGVDGRRATAIVPKPVLSCSATIGGLTALVKYCGAAPNFAGLVQINLVIPEGVTPGSSVPVQVSIGTAASQDGATIAVQ